MNRPTVYVALQQFCEHDDRARQVLSEAGFEVRYNTLGRRLRKDEMAALLHDADAVLAGVEPYDAALLAALPRLRCISRCGVGTDAIDLAEAARLGITVRNTVDQVVQPVAELTMAMILALARNLPQHQSDLRAGQWKKRSGFLLSEWTIGLIGFGRIGRAVERLIRAFGARVLVHDPLLQATDTTEQVTRCELSVLLAESDVVSVHATRSSDEGALIGQRELAMMKAGAYLVNTARGFLVDETALYQALISGHLAGAALDVFHDEPYTGPLTQLPQVVATPHVATLTRASRAAMELACVQQVVEYFEARKARVMSNTASVQRAA